MRKKNGISLLYLILIIILMLILAGTVLVNMDVSSDNTRLSTFANNITQIQEAVRAEYLLDGTIPQKSDTNVLSKDDVIAMVYEENREAFREELLLNNESAHVEFVEIDLGKLGVTKEKYGFGEKGTDDVYVVTTDTLRVYYLYGTSYKDERYFSLNSKIASILNISNEGQDNSQTNSNMYSGVFVSKNNAVYTNNMGINITANMNEGESLRISFKGADEKIFSTTNGKNVFSFSNLNDLNNQNILNSKFSETDINTFNNLSQAEKIIEIKKYNGSAIVGNQKINLSNYDATPPKIEWLTDNNEYDNIDIFQGICSDDISGVQQVRYVFFDNASTNVDEEYMVNKAKTTDITEDGIFSIKLKKKNAGILYVAAIDNAGNITIDRIAYAEEEPH